ncbi:MAG: hypothetical protein EAZ53_04265 [Bacteroidetes bacterium]|nr:MAG: hypothetical protein EAZ53_04265 [Bacteroidota bacterium]
MNNKVLFNSFLVYDIRIYIFWAVSAFLGPIIIYNLYISFSVLKFIVFFSILLVLFYYYVRQKVKIYSNKEIKFLYYIFGLEIYKSKKSDKISLIYIFRRNSSPKSITNSNTGNFSNNKGGILQPDIHLQILNDKNEIIFEILTDDEAKTTALALNLSKIIEVDIHDYRNREMEVYRYSEA